MDPGVIEEHLKDENLQYSKMVSTSLEFLKSPVLQILVHICWVMLVPAESGKE